MKLIKPFLFSLLLNAAFIGLMAFFFSLKKKTQPPHISLKNHSFKMKLHLKKGLLDKPQRINHQKKKKIEVPKLKKPKNKKKRQLEKKLEMKKEKKKEIKSTTPFRPSIISKLKGFIKRKIPYPYAAVVKNMEGKVHYSLTLNPNGKTSQYKMVQSSGHSLLDETVREFFLKNPLEGQIALNEHQKKPLIISDHIQFKIEDL